MKHIKLFEYYTDFYYEISKIEFEKLICNKIVDFPNNLIDKIKSYSNSNKHYIISNSENNKLLSLKNRNTWSDDGTLIYIPKIEKILSIKFPLYKVGSIQQSLLLNILYIDDDYFLVEESIYTFSKERMEKNYADGGSIQNGWNLDSPDIKYYKCDQYDGIIKLLSDRNIK